MEGNGTLIQQEIERCSRSWDIYYLLYQKMCKIYRFGGVIPAFVQKSEQLRQKMFGEILVHYRKSVRSV